ncbi:MAG: XdhC family protein [Xanthomonadales bacterium]|nr:XdhC family protein [Xanthomonadales bacterium]
MCWCSAPRPKARCCCLAWATRLAHRPARATPGLGGNACPRRNACWRNCQGVDDATPYRAALVMAHHFERDRAALAHLAARSALPPYIGLLGARTRADDLFATLPVAVRERLAPVLETPAGMPLGGHGAAAIALSLAARLQSLSNTASD